MKTADAYLPRLIPLTPLPLYLVGGSVRDLLMGTGDITDLDILVPSGSETVARAFADGIGGSFFFLDEERKITRVVKNTPEGALQFDFTDFIGDGLRADLGRRDFTMNAMALDLRHFLKTRSLSGLTDPFGGAADIAQRVVRMTGPGVLDDDPLRMLRAVRFVAVLGFEIEPETAERIRQRSVLVAGPAPERIRDEFFRILSRPGGGRNLRIMDELGLLPRLLPELDRLSGFSPGRYHTYDVRTHSMKTAGYLDDVLEDLRPTMPDHADRIRAHLDEELEHHVNRKALLRFSCLLHDIAKPETLSRDEEGRIHFYGHDSLGADMAKEACARFRLSRASEATVCSVIRQHMRLFNLSAPGGPSRSAVYRYCRDLGDAVPESLLLSQADGRATSDIMPAGQFMDTAKSMRVVLDYYYGEFQKTEAKPLVTGQDLIDRGLKPGPRFREILEEIRERRAAGMLNDRDDALRYLDGIEDPSRNDRSPF